MVSTRHLAALLALAVLAACSSEPDGPPRPTFSPNGEPLVPPQWPQKCEEAIDMWFDRLDTGHAGGVSLAALTADAERQYRLMDMRHDGKVTAEELSKYRLKIMGGHYLSVSTPGQHVGIGRGSDDEARPGDRLDEPADDDRPRKRHGEDDRPVDAYAALVSDQPDPVMSADNDLDGSVTWDEFRALVAQNFAEFDRDHTGVITKSEVERLCSRK
jgi:hypothetical protein